MGFPILKTAATSLVTMVVTNSAIGSYNQQQTRKFDPTWDQMTWDQRTSHCHQKLYVTSVLFVERHYLPRYRLQIANRCGCSHPDTPIEETKLREACYLRAMVEVYLSAHGGRCAELLPHGEVKVQPHGELGVNWVTLEQKKMEGRSGRDFSS